MELKFLQIRQKHLRRYFWKTFAEDDDEELEEKFRVYVSNILYKYKRRDTSVRIIKI